VEALRHQAATFWVAAAGIAAMIIGTMGPWMNVLGVQLPGWTAKCSTIIIVAVIAALFMWQHTQRGGLELGTAGMTLGAVGVAVCGWALYDIATMPIPGVGPGWGLYLSLAGCLMLGGASYLIRRDPTY
jgi:hypothetical protein